MLAALGALQAVLGATLPYLRADLGVGYRDASLHLTAFAVGGLLGALGSTGVQRVSSRLGLVVLGAGTGGVGLLLVAAAGVLAASLTGGLLMGAGVTFAFVGLWSGLSDQHGEQRAVALNEGEVAVSVGNLALPLGVGAGVAAGLGWRAAAVAVVIGVAGGMLGLRRTGLREPAGGTATGGRSTPAPLGGLTLLLVVVACVVGVEWTLTTWLSSFLDDAVELKRATAVALTGAFFAAMLIGRLIFSRVARRVGARSLLRAALVLQLAGLPVLLTSETIAASIVGILVVGAATGALFPLASALVLAAAGPASTRASGATMLVASIGVLAAPLTIGALAEDEGLRAALVGVAALPLVALAILAVRRP